MSLGKEAKKTKCATENRVGHYRGQTNLAEAQQIDICTDEERSQNRRSVVKIYKH